MVTFFLKKETHFLRVLFSAFFLISIFYLTSYNSLVFLFTLGFLLFFQSPLSLWFVICWIYFYVSDFYVDVFNLNFTFKKLLLSNTFILNFIVSFLLTLFAFILFLLTRRFLSFLLFKTVSFFKLAPKISQTEQVFLSTGQAWIEKDFFKGRLDIKKTLNQKVPILSQEEKNFLEQQTEKLCSLSTEWDFLKRNKLSLQEEEFLNKEKFFGLNTPKKHKGLEITPYAQAKVIEKIASHNIPLSILVMVPNSLGPAKLLLNYGSEEQKDQYLPDLSLGKKWPCFGLTESQAGSDASSIVSQGVLFKDKGDIKIKLNFEKRWITLSAKADLIGLAVQLKDPDQVYSKQKDLGITCLLIPSHLKGIQRGFYHDPMGLPIYNAPIKGNNIIVSAEQAIIGGLQQAGQGWKMLLESLSAGRAISLPSLSVAAAKKTTWLVGTHAFVRRQFGLPIGKFEAIQDHLGFIASLTHLMTATQCFTLSALNQGILSPVVSALTKYQLTEISQTVIKKGMDVMGGAGLSLGPKNKIALLHNSLPLAITVEGANILTRTLIVYGQGLIKLHPQAYSIIQSLQKNNFRLFSKNIYAFCYQVLSNFLKSSVFLILHMFFEVMALVYFQLKYIVDTILKNKIHDFCFVKRHLTIQKLRLSIALFSFLSDLSLIGLGTKLKRRGQLTGRFSDWMSLQYMVLALLWYQKNKKTDTYVLQYCLDYCFSEIQKTVISLLNNYPHFLFRMFLKPFMFLLRAVPISQGVSDSLGKKVAQKVLEDPDFKESLCEGMYFSKNKEDQFQILKTAYDLSLTEKEILKNKKDLSQTEKEIIEQAKKARNKAIQVDVFTKQDYFKDYIS